MTKPLRSRDILPGSRIRTCQTRSFFYARAAGGTGLRIVSSAPEPEDPSALQVTAAAGPGENDQVIEATGARVFLEPQAAAYLDDKVLDAQLDEQGKARFTLGTQDAGQI